MAACKGQTALFFANHPQDAKGICAGCPVSAECLEDAIEVESNPFDPFVDMNTLSGVRGGLTGPERKPFVKARFEARKAALGIKGDPRRMARKKARRQEPEIVHGSAAAYDRHGCRCDVCKKAKAERQRAYRLARKAGVA